MRDDVGVSLVEAHRVVDQEGKKNVHDVNALSDGWDARLKYLLPLFLFNLVDQKEAELLKGLQILLGTVLNLSELSLVISDVSDNCLGQEIVFYSVSLELLDAFIIFAAFGLRMQVHFSVFDKLV